MFSSIAVLILQIVKVVIICELFTVYYTSFTAVTKLQNSQKKIANILINFCLLRQTLAGKILYITGTLRDSNNRFATICLNISGY